MSQKLVITPIALCSLYHWQLHICNFHTDMTQKHYFLHVRWKTFWISTTRTSWTKWPCPSSRSPHDHHCHQNHHDFEYLQHYCNNSHMSRWFLIRWWCQTWRRQGGGRFNQKRLSSKNNIFLMKTRFGKRKQGILKETNNLFQYIFEIIWTW